MRNAAAVRSAWVSGSPWLMLASTERTNASSVLPSKYVTPMVSRPLSTAARKRCVPSMIRIVGRCTSTGGSVRPECARACA